MPSLAAALLVGLTAIAVVPGAEGPVPPAAAPMSVMAARTSEPSVRRAAAQRPVCRTVEHEAVPAPSSDDGLYGELADYGLHLLARLFEVLRVDIIDGLAPALNALDASAPGHPPA